MHHDAAFTTAGIHSRTWRVELLYSVMATSASCWNRAAHAATIHYQRETACQNVINWTDEAAENCRPAARERERAPGLYSVYSDRLLYIRLLGIQFVSGHRGCIACTVTDCCIYVCLASSSSDWRTSPAAGRSARLIQSGCDRCKRIDFRA